MSRSDSSPRIGIGIPSVLMVLVVLAMAALCMLSYSSATSTESMTKRNVEVSGEYYRLAAQGQEKLAQLDELLASQEGTPSEYWQSLSMEGVTFEPGEDGQVHFTLTVSGNFGKAIQMKGVVLENQPLRYRIYAHRAVNLDSETETSYLELMGGQN